MTVQEIWEDPDPLRRRVGFIVNRFFVPWLNEAVRLLEEGTADIPTIEAAAKRRSAWDGTIRADERHGRLIAMHAANTPGQAFGPFYARPPQEAGLGKPWTSGRSDPTKSTPFPPDCRRDVRSPRRSSTRGSEPWRTRTSGPAWA